MDKPKRKNNEFQYPEETILGSIERLQFAVDEFDQCVVDEIFNGNHPSHVFMVYLSRLTELATHFWKRKNV